MIEDERHASYRFFEAVLRENEDLAFLMSFDSNVELLQDYTDSRKLLSRGLDELRVESSVRGLHPGPTGSSGAVGTALYDAIYLACDEMFRGQVGRKALVIISDGNDSGSKMKLDQAIEAAHRADVVIFSIRYFDRAFYMRYGQGVGVSGALRRISRDTGGSLFEVTRRNTLSGIFDKINEEMRNQYSIGYSPKRDPSIAGFRKSNYAPGKRDSRSRRAKGTIQTPFKLRNAYSRAAARRLLPQAAERNLILEIRSVKFFISPLALCLSLVPASVALFGQDADAEIVVKIGGKGYTAEQLDRIRNTLPEQFRRNVMHRWATRHSSIPMRIFWRFPTHPSNPACWSKRPYKSQFAFLRLNFLAQSHLSRINAALSITNEEKKKYYEDHAGDYSESNVSAIHIEYDPLPELAERAGRAPVSEQDAGDKAEKLLSAIRAGADFAALAKEHSDDKLSAEEGGEIGWLSRDGQLPAALKEAVFALQEGEVSQAVKDGGKFYIFKVNEIRMKPYEEALSDILRKLEGSKIQAKLEEIRATMPVEFIDADYAAATPAAQ